MRRPTRALLLVTVLSLALALSGCGYTFTGTTSPGSEDAASRLAPEFRQMAMVRVENPTTEAWIEPRLRSLLRDELKRRRLVTWTDKAHATSHLVAIIKKYTRQTALTGQQAQTIKYTASLTLQLRVIRASDGAVLWDSGEQIQDESYYPGDAEGADMRVTDLAVRRMGDLMTQNY